MSVRCLRILLLGWNYAPEVAGIGPYTTELAEGLVDRGHKVTAVTSFPLYPEWRLRPGSQHILRWESLNGVSVRRGWVHVPRRRSATSRILFDSSVAGMALLNALPMRELDVVICVLPPLQLALAGLAVARLHRVPTVLHLQDIVPDLAVASGMVAANSLAIRIATRLESFVYARATRISVITLGFRSNLLAKGVPDRKLEMLPNWPRFPDTVVSVDRQRVRARLGLPAESFLVLHAGNMGEKQALDRVVAAAAEMVDGGDVHFALVGDGQARSGLEAAATERGLKNLSFLPLQDDLFSLLRAADALLMTQRPELVDSVVPSKLLTYMTSARPVVASVNPHSETARIVGEAGCGLLVDPLEPSSLARGIRALQALPEAELTELGESGRRFVSGLPDRQASLDRWEAMLVGLAEETGRPQVKPLQNPPT